MRLRLSLVLFALLASAGAASAQTGTITANGVCRSIDVDNKGQGTLEVSGTWTGTLTWYVSNGVGRATLDLGTPAAPGTAVNSTTANGHWEGNVGGWKTFEVCATAAWTGTATIWMNATNAASPLVFSSGGGGGTSDTTEATQLSVLAAVDGLETSLAIIDNVVFGAGLEATALRVTLPTDGTGVVGLTGSALDKLTSIDGTLDSLLNRVNPDQVEDTAPTFLSGPFSMLKAKDFDGSALPGVVSAENDPVIFAGSLYGVAYSMLTTEDGSKSPIGLEDDASADAMAGLKIFAIRDDTLDIRSGTEGDLEPFHTNAAGALWTVDVNSATNTTSLTNLSTYIQPGTLKRYISAGATEDESQVKATAGVLYGISAWNANSTTDAFLKCTNLTAANTTPGSSTVFYSMIVPHGSSGGSGYVQANFGPAGTTFDTALTCYLVTGKTDADATEVAANDVSYNLVYR